jgi:glycosyltransferase involved in cell wall biosynthesis/DNA-binding MarR family transcriptional regulator
MPTVSIIVPVYNAEKTLRRCVESVLDQEYTDFELLLVDDGSQDGSAAICDEYAARDVRVKVTHQENSGVSATRNLALEQAQGTYLQFLDSDDWITSDATSSLVRSAEAHQCDLVVADFYRVVGKRLSHKGDISEDAVLSREEYAAHMMKDPADFYYGVLWNKLYRRDIVAKYQLRMDPEISWCEDFMFNLEYIRHAERFYALQIPIYYYVKTKGSLATSNITLSKTIKMKLTVFEYYQKFFKSVFDEEEYEKSRLQVYRFLVEAAKDGAVLPGAKKLGNERQRVSPATLRGEGVFCDTFRERKLLERYLETAALKNDLSLSDAKLLLALRQLDTPCTRRELADFTGLARGVLTMALQRLSAKGLIQTEETRDESDRQLHVTFLDAAQPVLADLDTALTDDSAARLAGFDQDESAQYESFRRRIQENIQAVLQ